MYEQIAANKRKTFVLIFGFVVLLALVGLGVQLLAQGGVVGIVIVAVIVIVVVGRLVLQQRQGRARDVARASPPTRTSTPGYHNLVEGLCIASGLPKPRLYIIDDAAPNAFATGRNPQARGDRGHDRPAREDEPGRARGVLAHELSHIRNYDVLVMTLTVTMVGIIALLSDFFLRFMFWRRRSATTTTTATTRSASCSRSSGSSC